MARAREVDVLVAVSTTGHFARFLHHSGRLRTLRGMELGLSQAAGCAADGADAVLWRRGVAGDGEAFGLLFDRHRGRVFRHASRLVATRPDTEDLVATAFLELWRLRDRVRLVDDSVLPWLLATTTNLGLNARRARRRYERLLERLPRADPEPDVAALARLHRA